MHGDRRAKRSIHFEWGDEAAAYAEFLAYFWILNPVQVETRYGI